MTFLHVTHDPLPAELTAARDARHRQADASKADEAKAAARSSARAVAARLAAAKPALRPAPALPQQGNGLPLHAFLASCSTA